MKWTPKQEEVIKSRGEDLLVSAAAGSGKTAVLTARILELVKEGHSLDDFLVITFTRAAADDMKDKISRGLRALKRTPHLDEEIKKLPRAQISTIHAFCSSVLRENFHALDLDPNFRVASEGELSILEAQSLDEVMERAYKRGEESFYKLLEIFTDQRSDSGLRRVLVETQNYLAQKPRKEAYLERMEELYSGDSYWQELVRDRDRRKKEEFLSLYSATIELATSQELRSFLDDEKNMILTRRSQDYEFLRYPSGKAIKAEPFGQEIKAARDQWKKLLQTSSLPKKDQLRASYGHIQALVKLSEEFSQVFLARRLSQSKLSFGDLETLALRALEVEEIAAYYRKKFSFVFIDEYQDTSELQDYLVSLFVREGGLFMVGDIKQSIYAFREAKPQLFIDKFHSYEKTPGKRRIDLTKNFRSSKPILEATNRVFEGLMRKDFGGIDYDDTARLVFGNKSLEGLEDRVELLVSQDGSPVEGELRSIIARIKELLEGGASYKDIVILYRSPKSFIEKALELFREENLPLYSDQGESLLESLEVKILLNYLELINNGFLDLPLLSLLRLPRYGFSDQDLYSFRKKGSLFHQGFYEYHEPGELLDRKNFFLEEIRDLRWKSRQLGVAELLHYIYMKVDFESFALLMSGGEQRLMNIRYLFEKAQEFEETTQVGLSAFLSFIEKLKLQREDYESAKLLGEDADVIRLMSIHKSKGLQFPIVFVAGLWKNYNEMTYRGPLFYGEDLLVMDFFDLESREVTPSIYKEILIERSKIKNRQEELRLLYVAMTRAEKKLILSTHTREELVLGGGLSTWELERQKSFHDLLIKSLDKLLPPAPEYVMIELTDRSFPEGPGPRGKKMEIFRAPRAKKESYKTSVSSLLGDKEAPVELVLEGGGKKRGSLFHRAMELVDLDEAGRDLEAALLSLKSGPGLEDFSDLGLVRKFLGSDLGRGMLKSSRVLREQPFVLKKDDRLLQGVMDLAFYEAGGWVLVDYKTDGSLAYLDSYRSQLGYYVEALEKISGERVKKAYIYYLRLDEIFEIKETRNEA